MTGSELASQFSGLLPYAAVLLALLAGLLGALNARQATHPRSGPAKAGRMPPVNDLPDTPFPASLSRSVQQASWQFRRLVAGGGGIYEVPWIIAFGASDRELERLLPERLEMPPELSAAHLDLINRAGTLSVCRDGVVLGFDRTLTDPTHKRKALHDLLHAVRRCRPDRPVDGLVVVLPVTELQRSAEQLAQAGEQFYQLIWTVQRVTGWRIPINLLLTGCEELNGFQDWAIALPPGSRQRPLGWSVPYAIDTVFQPKWVDDAMTQLGQHLSSAQFSLMMLETSLEAAEGLFLFPGEVQRLVSPLTVLLTSMLRMSAYHEAFMFRGFFLSGNVSRATPNHQATSDVFGPATFNRHIFPEHKLAQPAYGEKTLRLRQVHLAQTALGVLAILCGIGLLYLWRVDNAYLPPVRQLLDRIEGQLSVRSLNHVASTTQESMLDRRRTTREAALSLLQAMADIQTNHVDTIAAPASSLSSVSADVEQAIATGYDKVVLRAVRTALTDEPSLELLLAPSAPTMPPQQSFTNTANRVQTYSTYVALYNALNTHANIDQLAKLLRYTLGVELPAAFTTNFGLYERALNLVHPRPILIGDVEPIVGRILQREYDAAVESIYGNSDLARAVKHLASLAGLDVQPAQGDGQSGRSDIVDIVATLAAIADQLALPDYAWLQSNKKDIAPALNLSKLDGLSAVDTITTQGFTQRAVKAEEDTRRAILNGTAFGSPIITLSGGKAGLSAPMSAVRTMLTELLSQPFMHAVAGNPVTPAVSTSGTPVEWNATPLRRAQDLAESYAAFTPRMINDSIPSLLSHQVQLAATTQLSEHIERLLTLAVRPTATPPQDTARAALTEAANLSQVLPLLTSLRNTLRQSGADVAADVLDAQVSGQAVRLLRQIDSDVRSAAPYQLMDPKLSLWHGLTPLTEAAFGAASPVELASTIPARRDFIETMAKQYAAPLVNYLSDPGTSLSPVVSSLVQRWQAILNVFDRYHRSDPNNSLTRLEQFITVDMDKIDAGNCSQFTWQARATAQDYFSEQLQAIQRAVASRCQTLVATDTAERYAGLAADFNEHFAGRFPFNIETNTNLALGDADPADVRRFLIQYADILQPLYVQLSTVKRYGSAGREAGAFLSQLLAIEQAFAPMLADPSGQTPLWYQVNVDFFTNPAAARSQDEVLDATVATDGPPASSMAGTSALTWTSGQQLHVGFRWAANAPSVPDPNAGVPGGPRIDGLNAGFSFRGRWALLRLVRSQTPPPTEANALNDRRPEVVRFTVPVKRNPAAAIGDAGDGSSARIYLRLALAAVIRTPGQPDKVIPVQLPIFPAAAPLLTQRPVPVPGAKPPGPTKLLSSKAFP